MSRTHNPKFLEFGHKKFTKKARNYRYEVSFLTVDLLNMVRKANRQLAICEGIVKILGSKKRRFRIDGLENESNNFVDLLYSIENFNYRLHGYRDKLCIFLNYVMRLGYDESDTDLLNKLIRHEKVKKSNIATELKKLQSGALQNSLSRRKSMSHRIYYDDTYNPLFIPDESPRDIGFYKAAGIWKRKMIKEVNNIDICMEKIFEINERVAKKLAIYLNGT